MSFSSYTSQLPRSPSRPASAFGLRLTIEVLERSWQVKGQSVRPDHRMVAHTGFLTTARLLSSAEEVEATIGEDPA